MGDTYAPLRQRISYFSKSPDGRLWIATYGAGIICLKNDQVINHITTQRRYFKQYLQNPFCKQQLPVGRYR